jgi:hypothetical protein
VWGSTINYFLNEKARRIQQAIEGPHNEYFVLKIDEITSGPLGLKDAVKLLEAWVLERAKEASKGRIVDVLKILKISRPTYYKLWGNLSSSKRRASSSTSND